VKLKIGNLEFSDLTILELKEIVSLYGSPEAQLADDANVQTNAPRVDNLPHAGHADKVLLQKLLEAGPAGVSTDAIGEILQRRGRALPTALEAWSRRVGLKEGTIDPFEPCRVGTKRHYRIKTNLLEVARRIAG